MSWDLILAIIFYALIVLFYFKNKKKFSALPAKITVTVISANRPVAISDIDHTISNMGAKDFLFRPIEEIPTLPNAVEGIESLALNHQVVYLTARDDTFTSKTDRWMEYNQFVAGPVYFWDFGFGNGVPGNHGEYKSGVIARMKKKFNKVLIGVGDKPHDVAAYREHGLRAYYIGKNLEEPLPSGTIIIKSWDAITAHLKKNPIGSLAGDPTP